jgi:hypothetical protein
MRANGDMLERCIDSVVAGLKDKLPATEPTSPSTRAMPAYANGQRYVYKGPRTQLAHRPRRFLGAPLGGLNPARRWLLRLQAPDGLLHEDRATGCVVGRDREGK